MGPRPELARIVSDGLLIHEMALLRQYNENICPRTRRVKDVSCGDTYIQPKLATPERLQLSEGIERANKPPTFKERSS